MTDEQQQDDTALIGVAGYLLQLADTSGDERIARLAATSVDMVTKSNALPTLLKELAQLRQAVNKNPFIDRMMSKNNQQDATKQFQELLAKLQAQT